ncbi:MAG: fibronectin type III domain-containing protein [Bacteroidales bacterium]|nr:fibronectin type III domain-containing protein [Candidatus Cacconaster merdequi]
MSILTFLLAAIFSITTNPGEDTRTQMNISWGTDTAAISSFVLYAPERSDWKKALRADANGRFCAVYDSVYSKNADGENFYEDARFLKYDLNLDDLSPKTRYKYRIYAVSSDGDTTVSEVCRFTTSGSRRWKACIISDFHCYPPLPKRLEAATAMMDAVKATSGGFDWVISLGDVCAWGGSYSFWKYLYGEQEFRDYMWGGVNGNHDNMTRNYVLTNEFFRNATANPLNGYEGEEGVCYWFKYGDALFIMLNNENMRDSTGFGKACAWVEKVLSDNSDARYKVVCEHYQWFFGTEGKTSQYSRWHELFEKYGVTLALAGNNHIYVRAHSNGVNYIQTPSSDNERGQDLIRQLEANEDKIDFRWNEGPHTVGAMYMDVTPRRMKLVLLDRSGNVIDEVAIRPR